MKFRQAAALALVGWYLMVPYIDTKTGKAQPLPLSNWVQEGSYDTANDCSEAQQGMIALDKKMGYSERYIDSLIVMSKCISTDDPRLAK